MKRTSQNQGFIRTIIIIIVALLVLSYFGLNIRTIVNSPAGKDNFSFTQELMISTWNNYLKTPTLYVWHLFADLIWNPSIDHLNKAKNGGNDNIKSSSPLIATTTSP